MSAAAQPPTRSKAPTLLLEHVALFGAQPTQRPPALDRLEQVLGRELAVRLLSALSGDHRMRPRLL